MRVLLLVSLLVSCADYQDIRQELHEHLKTQYPQVENTDCIIDGIMEQANDQCVPLFTATVESFSECYKEGNSFFDLLHTNLELIALNCQLKETAKMLDDVLKELR